jgi:hypothetical protein
MSDLRDRIAAVLEKHAVAQYSWGPEGCICDYKLDISDEDHPRHQADAVIRDVLTPEFLADLVIAAVQKAADDE